MKVNFELLKAIKEKGLSQKDFASLVGAHPTKVSRVISGVWNLSKDEQERYSRALGKKAEELFDTSNVCGSS